MKTKTFVSSILIAVVAGSAISLTAYSLIPDISQVYANKTLNDDDIAKIIQVRMWIEGEPEEKVFDSFSKIGFVRSRSIEFFLESIPSKDKKPFYDFIDTSLRSSQPPLLEINIDVISGDGTLLETLNYRKCIVTSYFIHVNDSKGKFTFLDEGTSKMEIREVTKFQCSGLSIKT